jgi:hypothetical protein
MPQTRRCVKDAILRSSKRVGGKTSVRRNQDRSPVKNKERCLERPKVATLPGEPP